MSGNVGDNQKGKPKKSRVIVKKVDDENAGGGEATENIQ